MAVRVVKPDRNLDHLFPAFRRKVAQIIALLGADADSRWTLVEGYRTAEYQQWLYQRGRTRPPLGRRHVVTFCDGVRLRSAHQSSLAADIVPTRAGRVLWNADPAVWARLGEAAKSQGLTWGGGWRKLRDLPHVEWPERDRAAYEAARSWQRGFGLR